MNSSSYYHQNYSEHGWNALVKSCCIHIIIVKIWINEKIAPFIFIIHPSII